MSPAARRAWTPVVLAAIGIGYLLWADLAPGRVLTSDQAVRGGVFLAAAVLLGFAPTRSLFAAWCSAVSLVAMGLSMVILCVGVFLLGPHGAVDYLLPIGKFVIDLGAGLMFVSLVMTTCDPSLSDQDRSWRRFRLWLAARVGRQAVGEVK